MKCSLPRWRENVNIIENQRNQTLNLSLKLFEASQVFQQDDKNLVFLTSYHQIISNPESTREYRKLRILKTQQKMFKHFSKEMILSQM